MSYYYDTIKDDITNQIQAEQVVVVDRYSHKNHKNNYNSIAIFPMDFKESGVHESVVVVATFFTFFSNGQTGHEDGIRQILSNTYPSS